MSTAKLELLVFDLDGVITSEEKYWNTARLAVWDILTQPQYLGISNYFGSGLVTPSQVLAEGNQVINIAFITELKNRAVNSNWDLTFFVVCLHLIGILQQTSLEIQEEQSINEQLHTLGVALAGQKINQAQSQQLIQQFWMATTHLQGNAVQDYVMTFAEQILGKKSDIFSPQLWQICYQNFQDWYEAKKGYQLPDDETVLDTSQIRLTLAKLTQHYTLGIATGRPCQETLVPLAALSLLSYFDADRIVTYDEVLAAEDTLPQPLKLGKPHPFIVLQAIYPQASPSEILAMVNPVHPHVAYIGDAASDVVAAKMAGCLSIGVLTGFGQNLNYKKQILNSQGCDIVLPSILDLPAWLLASN